MVSSFLFRVPVHVFYVSLPSYHLTSICIHIILYLYLWYLWYLVPVPDTWYLVPSHQVGTRTSTTYRSSSPRISFIFIHFPMYSYSYFVSGFVLILISGCVLIPGCADCPSDRAVSYFVPHQYEYYKYSIHSLVVSDSELQLPIS